MKDSLDSGSEEENQIREETFSAPIKAQAAVILELPKSTPFRKVKVLYARRKRTKPVMGLILCPALTETIEYTKVREENYSIIHKSNFFSQIEYTS